MKRIRNRLAVLLLVLILLAFSASLYFFFDDIVEKFNQNKYVVFGGWVAGVLGTLLGIFSLLSASPTDPQRLQAEQARKKRSDLLMLLDSVETVWITDVLEHSLHQMVL